MLQQGIKQVFHGDASLAQRSVQIRAALVVVQMDMGKPRTHLPDPLDGRRTADAGVGMAGVEAQPQARVVHLPYNLHQHVRRRLHHVLQRKSHVRRGFFQKFTPESNGLPDIPLRKIDLRDIASVDHQPRNPKLPRKRQRLAVPLDRDLTDQRVNSAGEQLREGCVQPEV